MAQGRAMEGVDGVVHSPREGTRRWAVTAMAVCLIVAVLTHDGGYLLVGTLCFAYVLQTAQRLVVDGRVVRRVGLRAVELNLGTAEILKAGAPWWRELFFASTPLMLRDAEGHRLYLESWLWEPTTISSLLEAVPVPAHT